MVLSQSSQRRPPYSGRKNCFQVVIFQDCDLNILLFQLSRIAVVLPVRVSASPASKSLINFVMLIQIKFRVILQDMLSDQIRNAACGPRSELHHFLCLKTKFRFHKYRCLPIIIFCHLQKVFFVEKSPAGFPAGLLKLCYLQKTFQRTTTSLPSCFPVQLPLHQRIRWKELFPSYQRTYQLPAQFR